MFGPTLGLPQWAQDLSPFTHIPKAPATDVTAAPVVVLAGICLALAVAGVVAIRRRNLILPA
jgi:ABC-2 type transport system permease protein